jgi:hypothetical protein
VLKDIKVSSIDKKSKLKIKKFLKKEIFLVKHQKL